MRRDAPGSIVLIGSMSGAAVNIPQPQSPYNASKAGAFSSASSFPVFTGHLNANSFDLSSAVRHMASSLAVEWATKNIRVNVISPGYMATALTRVILDRDPELRDAWVNLTPMGRIGEPEDLKGAVIYLASDASAFTTGADLRVDGGYTLVSFSSIIDMREAETNIFVSFLADLNTSRKVVPPLVPSLSFIVFRSRYPSQPFSFYVVLHLPPSMLAKLRLVIKSVSFVLATSGLFLAR